MSDLKPCPFCNGKDVRFTNKTTAGGKKRHVAMYCNKCHSYGPRTLIQIEGKTYLTSKERKSFGLQQAITAWNSQYKDARIAELEGQNKTLASLLDMFDRYQGNQDDYLDSPFCAEVRETLFSFGLIQEDERPKLTAKELLAKDGE